MSGEALFELDQPEVLVLPYPQQWTAGAAALGYGGIPSKRRTTPELCPYFLHPGVTYNQWLEQTWCLCGAKRYPGNTVRNHLACCEGALTEPTNRKTRLLSELSESSAQGGTK